MNKKRVIIASVVVILLLALIGGSYAWFYINEDVTVSYGNSVFCEAGDSLEIAFLKGNEGDEVVRWGSTLDYSTQDFTLVDISGNGSKLYRPREIDESQQPAGMDPAVSNLDDAKKFSYIELRVAFRSVSKMNVYLNKESFINPVIIEGVTNVFGDFSPGYIAGAMRVAILDDETKELLMLWAPNSKYQLIDNMDGTYKFKENGDSESKYSYYAENADGEIVETDVTSDMFASKQFVVDSTGSEKAWAGDSPVLVSLNPITEGAYDQKNVRIRIWFEGTDREAHQALAGGNVNVKLKFVGVAKETDTAKEAAIDNVHFNGTSFVGVAEGMVFSTDGRKWSTTAPEASQLPSGSVVYVKYPETDEHFETHYTRIVID